MNAEALAAPTIQRPFLSRGLIAAAAFTAAYLVAATIAALATGNTEFLFYIAIMLILAAGVLILHARIRLPAAAVWALAIWGALHMAGGLVPVPESWPINGDIRVLYSWWIWPAEGGGGYLKYDHITHAYGFGVATWVCWLGMRSATGVTRATPGSVLLAALAGLGLGASNEVVEFIATLIADTNVGGYVNTGWDLVANSAGALTGAALILAFSRR